MFYQINEIQNEDLPYQILETEQIWLPKNITAEQAGWYEFPNQESFIGWAKSKYRFLQDPEEKLRTEIYEQVKQEAYKELMSTYLKKNRR